MTKICSPSIANTIVQSSSYLKKILDNVKK
jgi:hypothetical protein